MLKYSSPWIAFLLIISGTVNNVNSLGIIWPNSSQRTGMDTVTLVVHYRIYRGHCFSSRVLVVIKEYFSSSLGSIPLHSYLLWETGY